MATSSLAISSSSIVTHANATANAAADVNTNITAIVNGFNASLETSSGHYHDGTDSRLPYGGIAGFTSEDMQLLIILGAFRRGGL